jgi:hypothetical protein
VTTSGQKKRMNYTKKADAAFSKLIRSRGICELAPMRPETECSGPLQCCHRVSRRYRAVRWNTLNAMAGCAAHHMYFTHHPLEWDQALLRSLGEHAVEGLKWMALNRPPEDPKDALARLDRKGTE